MALSTHPTANTIFLAIGLQLNCDGEIIDQSRIEIYNKMQLLKSDALVGTMNVTKSTPNNQTAAYTSAAILLQFSIILFNK